MHRSTTHRSSAPRRQRRLLVGIVLITLLGAAAAASGVTLGASATIDATVHDVPLDPELRAGLGTVTARSPDGDRVARLRLERDGERVVLRGVLPDLAGSPLLEPITSLELWPCPVNVTNRAHFLPVQLHADGLGAVNLGTAAPAPDPLPGDVLLVFVYADAAVSVAATCSGELDEPLVVDVRLHSGWNLLASELVHDAGGRHLWLRASTATERARARWFAGPSGTTGPRRLDVVPRGD